MYTGILPAVMPAPVFGPVPMYKVERRNEDIAFQLAAIVESSYDIILSKNLDGIIMSWNKGAETAYGYKASEIIGKHISVLLPDESEDETIKFMDLIKSGIRIKQFETIRKTKYGNLIHVSLSISPIRTPGGTIIGASTIGHDITNQRQLEAELLQKNEELVRTNAEKDKFLSIVAHDLRSPFSAFLGLTRILDEDVRTFTQDETQEYARHLHKSADQLYLLLENLLEWSGIQHGICKNNPATFPIVAGLVSTLEIANEIAEKKVIKIINTISEGLKVTADQKMFKSLMRNILLNAIKFTPEGGEIVVSAKALPTDEIQISVKDTGIGMSNELMEKLFHIDEYVSRKGTNDEPSSGLGLIICKDYIKKNGGRIWVESKVDIGSTFHVTLPYRPD